MSFDADFNQDMKKFIQMLKKLLKNHPVQDKIRDPQESPNSSDINMNIFIFPLIPLTPEEMDELEEVYDPYGFDEDKNVEELSANLTESDLDFLRRYGIRF